MIRAIAWHPSINEALIIGSANGDLNKLKLSPMGAKVRSYLQPWPRKICMLMVRNG